MTGRGPPRAECKEELDMRPSKMLACVSLSLLVLSTPAWGQEGRGGREGRMPRMRQLSQEKMKVAWSWEARELARALDLGADETKQLVEAYAAGREGFREAQREFREAQRDGKRKGMRWLDPETIQEHRSALKTQLSGFLSRDQAEEATRSLGLFSSQWDRMVDGVAGLEFGEETTLAALTPIRQYIVRIADAQRLAREGEPGDRQAVRGLMGEAREGLRDGLTAVLTEEQLAQMQENQRGRRGGREEHARGEGRGEGRAPEHATTAVIGEPAPAFTLDDSTGRSHSLADYSGKIVVLQWINPDCPVCRRVASTGLVTAMRKRLYAITPGVVHLAINSTHYMEPSVGEAYFKKHKIDAPVLIDRDGKVGHLYDAKRTPHVYVIDAKGILRYQGAIDDDQRGDKGDQATNYVVQAVQQIVAGETVAPDVTRSYGCSVKYAPTK
jgi:peroxiredoxin